MWSVGVVRGAARVVGGESRTVTRSRVRTEELQLDQRTGPGGGEEEKGRRGTTTEELKERRAG